MNPSRKKFTPKTNSKNQKTDTASESDSQLVVAKIDSLKSSVKKDQLKIKVTDHSKNKQLAGAMVIIIVGMSAFMLFNIGGPTTHVVPPPCTKDLQDHFKQDTCASPIFVGNKLAVYYVGGEFCPYCGAFRWALVMALSQYGSFANLQTIVSAESQVPTYSFVGSSFTCTSIDFQPAEVLGNTIDPNTGHYIALESMNSKQDELITKYNSGGSIPFICIGGVDFRADAGVYLHPSSFSGKSFSDVQLQVTSKSGPLYNQIKTESDYLITLINQLLVAHTTTSATTTV